MERFDGVMYTCIGVLYPCCIGIGVEQRRLVRSGLQNCQLRVNGKGLYSVLSQTFNYSLNLLTPAISVDKDVAYSE